MGIVLDIKKKIDLIDDFIDYYDVEKSSIESRIELLNKELDESFRQRHSNIEQELENKIRREEDAILDEEGKRISSVASKFSKQISDELIKIQTLEKEREENIKEDCLMLDLLIRNKDTVLKKLEEFQIEGDVQSVIKRNYIPQYTKEQILSFIKDVKEVEGGLMQLSLQDINLEFINKEFWFPAGRMEGKIRNPNNLTILKFINVVGVITIIGLYSGIITTGLLGALSYYGVKNSSQWKTINQYRNWMYTFYEYEGDLRKVIRNYHEDEIKEELLICDNNIKNLEREQAQIEGQIKEETKGKLIALRENYINEKTKKSEEVQLELQAELRTLKSKSAECLNEIENYMDIFVKSMLDEKSKLKEDFEKLNKFELKIPNSTILLDLNRIHMGVEVGHTDVNHFSDLPFGSYLFVYNRDKTKMRNVMKYLTCQIASRLKGNLLNINILDPLAYGEGLSEIVDGKSIGQFYSDNEVSEKIDSMLDKFTRDIKNIFTGYDNITEFNEEKARIGSVPYAYTLNLVQNVDIFSDMVRFKQLLQTKKSGVINLILISSDLVEEVKNNIRDSEVRRAEFIELMDLFARLFTCSGERSIRSGSVRRPEEGTETSIDRIKDINDTLTANIRASLNVLEDLIIGYELEEVAFKPIAYEGLSDETQTGGTFEEAYISADQFRAYGKQITENIEKSAMTIYYFKDFVRQAVPEGKEFAFDSTKGIYMPFGYKDGDIEKLYSIPIDGETIHIFMGGRTGMGKSNTLNVGIGSALRMYSPDDLHIYLMDFKVIEGKKYMVNPTPHFKCISVTEDPYYLISLFNYLIKLLKYRQEVLIPKYNAGKIADIKKMGIKVPEIVVIIDEFTEGLKAPDEVKQMILESSDTIARLGRASGMHLFYTSQDVSDKLPDGTLGQFAGRLSLPVSKADTSKQIILNPDAADPDYQEMGNLLFNNKGGDSKHNVRMKVPLIEPEDMNENFEYVNKLCAGKYEMNCVMFDAEETKSEDELDFYLTNYKDLIRKSGKIILGGNAQFDTEDSPVGMDLIREDSHNIFILSQGKKRRIELTNTLIKNIAIMEGEDTVLTVLRGNKDYLDFNYIDKYKDYFKTVIELEDVDSLIEMIRGSRLAVLESELREYGVEYDSKSENFENFKDLTDFIGMWDKVKRETVEAGETSLKKLHIAHLIEVMRKHTPKCLVIVEGAEEVHGIGVDNYDLKEYAPILRFAPYYGILNVWNASKTPVRFSLIESVFRHRLLGSLDVMDTSEYKFMKETRSTYGGYMNIINPSGVFKYKIFRIEGLSDDEVSDNRIVLNG